MVSGCCAYGCTNRSSKPECREKGISFHLFPLNDKMRVKLWLLNIRRKSFEPTKYTKICSEHFDEDDFEYKSFTNQRMLKKTAVPKKFCFDKKGEKQRLRTSYEFGSGVKEIENCDPAKESPNKKDERSGVTESENCDPAKESPNELDGRFETEICDPMQGSSNEIATQTNGNFFSLVVQELQNVKAENAELKRKLKGSDISYNDSETQTQGNSFTLLLQELQTVKAENAELKSKSKESEIGPENLDDKELTTLTGFSKIQFDDIHSFLSSIDKQKLFLFLVRLKSGMTESMIGLFFRKSQSTISRAITSVTKDIFRKISSVRIWQDRNTVLENMPDLFRQHFKKCRVILDCMEFEIQKPKDKEEHQLTFSKCKNTNTVKCLIGIAPSGDITFISEAVGGSVSDKDLFLQCGFLDLLEPGDIIIADSGLNIKAEVEAKWCTVVNSDFSKDKIVFNIIEKKENKKFIRHRVLIERASSRIKQFKFFSSQIPYSSVQSISKLLCIAVFFTNFGNSLIKC